MFFSHTNGRLVLILDVQSSVVRGTLVHMREAGQVPLVIYTRETPIAYKAHARSGYLVKNALRAIDDTIQDTLIHLHARRSGGQDIPHTISAVHYVLSSPWIISQAKTLAMSYDKRRIIDRAYINKLIADDRSKLVSDTVENVRIIEEKIFDVRLNGYSVPGWEGQSTDKLEVSFVASVAGGRMIDHFTRACDRAVHHGHVYFHSSLFLQHLGLGAVIHDYSSYALIHVHGELTDVALVHADSCTFFGSYPFGINSIIRTIARETKTDDYTAESLLNMFTEDRLDPAHTEKELAIVRHMGDGWIGEFRKLLKASPTPDALPRHVIMSAHSHEDFFIKDFARAYPASSIELLTMDIISPLVAFDTYTERLRLTGVYVIAIHSIEHS